MYKEAIEAPVIAGVSTLSILNRTGDLKVHWTRGNAAETEMARDAFNTGRSKGMMAYRLTGGGAKGEVLSEFDPTAEKIILAPPLAGGSGATL